MRSWQIPPNGLGFQKSLAPGYPDFPFAQLTFHDHLPSVQGPVGTLSADQIVISRQNSKLAQELNYSGQEQAAWN